MDYTLGCRWAAEGCIPECLCCTAAEATGLLMQTLGMLGKPPSSRPLTAPALRLALISGARKVIADRHVLNRINVFPVADGDTGNNLASTLGSVLNGALRQRSRHAGELMGRVGEEAIDGARGNSGAILAQFLYGMSERVRDYPALDVATLASAVRHGANSARTALAVPVEGTILSVIDRFADAFDAAARNGGNPGAGFADALQQARHALARTPEQMPLLRKAGLVDAGAQGFVDMLEGVAEFLDGGPRALRMRSAPVPANDDDPITVDHATHDEVDPGHRWCTECLLTGTTLDREGVRDALLASDARSLVVAGGARRLRVHAHVAQPQSLFDACARHGDVDAMKADDMLLQARSMMTGMRVGICTDSAADLPDALIERHAIHVVPLRVNVDGRDYLDKAGLATTDFYERMGAASELPKTSQPPPGDFRRVFDFLASHHQRVLYVGLSREVSGTLQSAEQAAARTTVDTKGGAVDDAASRQIEVFDTVNAAGGQALLVWRAAELAAEGADASAIIDELARLRPQTLTYAMARDISHAVRGGRIPAWAGPAVQLTGLTPIVRMGNNGKLSIAGGLFAKARVPEAFAASVAKRVPKGTRWRLIVGHCDARSDGERALAVLLSRLEVAESYLVETGPAIGAHAGRGALVVSLQPAP